jgi:galactonate dehydratase
MLIIHREERRKQGFKAVKMNGTGDTAWLDSPSVFKEVVDRVASVKALGMDVAVDFHGRLHKPMAKRLARALEPHEPLFIEEPLLSEHIGGIKQVSEQTNIPIALGERVYSRWGVRPFLENGSVDILQPDICHVGGISEMRRIASVCETYDVAIAPHCPLGPIALAANVQVVTATPNFAIQEMGIGMHYNGTQDITSYISNPEIWKVTDGHIDILHGPGLGIQVDEQQIRQLSEGAKAWPCPEFRGPCGELREW